MKAQVQTACKLPAQKVAEITGLTLGTVRQYVARGVIPALYLGRERVV
jgi:hypothetical protein